MIISDSGLYSALCVLIALALGGYGLWLLLALLKRGRPDLAIGRQIVVAYGIRLFAAVALGQLAIAQSLRGGDEILFVDNARSAATERLGSPDVLELLTSELHVFLFSFHMRVLEPDPPDLMLRVAMITASVAGVMLLAAAAHELAGPKASRIVAWVVALEPAHVFFSSILHKEPLMFLAEGLVAYGGALLWKRGRLTALVPIVVGCLIATATRPYAGWFLAAAGTAVVLHASFTRQQGLRALALSGVAIALIVAFVPTVWNASSDESLESLQASQDANAADTRANLSLEQVDYSTREKLITNLPKRISDVVFKPYPWQSQNTSQRLGVVGTLVVLFTLGALFLAVVRGGGLMARAGPLVYPALFMLIAYSLSAGNAGTAYRYRTHVVALALTLVVVLYQRRRAEEQAPAPTAERVAWKPLTPPTLVR